MGSIMRYDAGAAKAAGRPEGSVLTVSFELEGAQFTALNGGPVMQFSGAVSFVVSCDTQEEIDYYWSKLSEGGEEGQCGWINRDKFGLTWQIVPSMLPQLISTPAGMQAMLGMKKFAHSRAQGGEWVVSEVIPTLQERVYEALKEGA